MRGTSTNEATTGWRRLMDKPGKAPLAIKALFRRFRPDIAADWPRLDVCRRPLTGPSWPPRSGPLACNRWRDCGACTIITICNNEYKEYGLDFTMWARQY